MNDDGYDHSAVERRWQEAWDEADVYRTPDEADDPTYVLGMYPYPSGELHMGHVRNYTITDAYARFRRMQGDAVLHPMGWDAFGLPAENAAKERDTNPRDWTFDCIATMKQQMESMGFGYDWDREITTCTPEYYKWNQWLFRRFYEKGLAERRAAEVNWCPSCETVLADEQVEGDDELCWRCGTSVGSRELEQWFLKITDYADELIDCIDQLEGWPNSVRQMQRNWIGRQEGTRLTFTLEEADIDHERGTDVDDPNEIADVEAFTTRVDTIFGATFFALAPDHPVTEDLIADDPAVATFVETGADPEGDEPNGVETDLLARNPVTGETLPVFVADFVLSDVGTGALMGVPGHDDRDHAFAKKMGIDIVPVIAPSETDIPDVKENAYTADGILVNSAGYTGLESEEARTLLTDDIQSAEFHTQYRLRDWGISRQRYWGTPIPVVHCPDCGPVLIPADALPVELPAFINTAGNPLDVATEWKQTTCPECGTDAVRETDTMDTFVDSSWYFLRYVSPDLDSAPYDLERVNEWMPVDLYVGGIEHAVMHLLYARFVTKTLADYEGLTHREPFTNLLAQGMVQLDGEKMSKSKGNVVSPQAIVDEYGADTARLFMMQAAQPDRDFDWSEEGVQSAYQFLTRLKQTVTAFANGDIETSTAQSPIVGYVDAEIETAIVVATEEYNELTFNDAIREAQSLVDTLRNYRDFTAVHPTTYQRGLATALQLLAPITPHITEELWSRLPDGAKYSQTSGETAPHQETMFIINSAWPDITVDRHTHEMRRQLIENTRADVRQIIDVADIDNPHRIDIVVTPAWKYQAHQIAQECDADNIIPELMEHDSIKQHGDAAATYGQDLQENREALQEHLDPEAEYAALESAAWLIEREFSADVRVLTADDAPDSIVQKARPNRPAIDITT